jgi:hypothetical protein
MSKPEIAVLLVLVMVTLCVTLYEAWISPLEALAHSSGAGCGGAWIRGNQVDAASAHPRYCPPYANALA